MKEEIEITVKAQFGSLLAERSALATLVNVFPSPRVKKALDTLRQTQDTIIGLGKTLSGKEKTLLDAIAYVFWVEVSASLLADVTIIMLSTRKQVLHIEPDEKYRFMRHATSIEDLESPSVSLATKINFLKYCGFDCFEKYIDRTLRNKIAHMDFEIDIKGNLFLHDRKGGKLAKKQVDFEQKLNRLLLFNHVVMRQLTEAVYRTKESQRKE